MSKRGDASRNKTYEEMFGKTEAQRLKNLRKQTTIKQMKSLKQRELRSQKMLGIPKSALSIKKMKETKRMKNSKRYDGIHYRRRALEHFGHVCMRCGESFPEKHLVVHHIDAQNISTELGNHQLENLMVLCKSCHARLHNEMGKTGHIFCGLSSVERGMHLILQGLRDEYGLDISTEHFKNTPKRVARAYAEIFSGVKETEKQLKQILSTSFSSKLDSMVIVKDIQLYSMCPHHFLPVVYFVDVGYIPNGRILGLSKLARVAELLARRPVVQEDYCSDVTDAIMKIEPKGVAVRVVGQHFCMQMRGAKKLGSWTTTSCMRGVFMSDASTRSEFLSMLTTR